MTGAAAGSVTGSHSLASGKCPRHGGLAASPRPVLSVGGDTGGQGVSSVCPPLGSLPVRPLQGRAVPSHGLPHAHCSAGCLSPGCVDTSLSRSAAVGHGGVPSSPTASPLCRAVPAGFSPGFPPPCDVRRALPLATSHGVATF